MWKTTPRYDTDLYVLFKYKIRLLKAQNLPRYSTFDWNRSFLLPTAEIALFFPWAYYQGNLTDLILNWNTK